MVMLSSGGSVAVSMVLVPFCNSMLSSISALLVLRGQNNVYTVHYGTIILPISFKLYYE